MMKSIKNEVRKRRMNVAAFQIEDQNFERRTAALGDGQRVDLVIEGKAPHAARHERGGDEQNERSDQIPRIGPPSGNPLLVQAWMAWLTRHVRPARQ